ncbi:lysylphosphatidylglycerol synthase transmembrane domain-containing protein [Haloplanus natans]|uniref:lysylphosphatidylglycerol synthase transmembrane domain-containing protein n=1 Tax=Haloplanus natans TaxID=376171 RepID=UPI0006781A11|nr:lysylphosphatidylglycerol synthase transmembrane domain-containing protein [Haloplanus natans]
MNLRKNLWEFVVIGLAVTLALSVYAEFDSLIRALSGFDWWLLPVVLGLTLLNQLLRFVKWEYLLRRIDVRLPPVTSLGIFGSGLIMILTPGKLGEVWKSWLIRDVTGSPVSATLPVVATERITDLLGVVTISTLGVVAFDYSPVFLLVVLLPVLGGIGFLQYERGCLRLITALEGIPVVCRRIDDVRTLYLSSQDLLRPRPLAVTTLLSTVSWGMECFALWVVLSGFGAEVRVTVAAFVFAVSSILGALSLLPGGLGVTEGSMTGLLLLFDVPRVTAVSATLITRAATLWFSAGLALLVYVTFQWQTMVDGVSSD